MSEPTARVWLDLGGVTRAVGSLWTLRSRGRETATFVYEPSWLPAPERFALEPALQVAPGAFHTRAGHALFGSLGDSAPDRWGRTLIARARRADRAVPSQAASFVGRIGFVPGVGPDDALANLRDDPPQIR